MSLLKSFKIKRQWRTRYCPPICLPAMHRQPLYREQSAAVGLSDNCRQYQGLQNPYCPRNMAGVSESQECRLLIQPTSSTAVAQRCTVSCLDIHVTAWVMAQPFGLVTRHQYGGVTYCVHFQSLPFVLHVSAKLTFLHFIILAQCPFYGVPDHSSCHGLSRRVYVFY